MTDEVLEYKIVEESDIKKVANDLINSSLEKQTLVIDNIYAKSAIFAVKVGIELIEMVKKTNDETMKSNKQFMTMCNKAIDTLNKTIEDGQVSEEEKKDVRDKLFEIIKMANDSNSKAVSVAKEGRDKAIVASAIVGGTIGAIGILGLIGNAIAKSIKK